MPPARIGLHSLSTFTATITSRWLVVARGLPPRGPIVNDLTRTSAVLNTFIRTLSTTNCKINRASGVNLSSSSPASALGTTPPAPISLRFLLRACRTSRANGARSLYKQSSCAFACSISCAALLPRAPGDDAAFALALAAALAAGDVPASRLASAFAAALARAFSAAVADLNDTHCCSWPLGYCSGLYSPSKASPRSRGVTVLTP